MKKIITIIISAVLALALCACGSSGGSSSSANAGNAPAEAVTEQAKPAAEEAATLETTTEDPLAEDISALEGIGDIEVSEGMVYVYVTLPAILVGDTTQADIDAAAGENYTSGKLNDDGSITYKMTRKQHSTMLETVKKAFEDGCNNIISEIDMFGITAIEPNNDYSLIKVTLNSNEVGLAATLSVMALYTYGGIYGILSGHPADNIVVEFYSPDGELIETANSADAGF